MGPNPAAPEAVGRPAASALWFNTRATIALTETAIGDVVIPLGGFVQVAKPDPNRILAGAFAHPSNAANIVLNPWSDKLGFKFADIPPGGGGVYTNFSFPGMTFTGWWATGTPGDVLRIMEVRTQT